MSTLLFTISLSRSNYSLFIYYLIILIEVSITTHLLSILQYLSLITHYHPSYSTHSYLMVKSIHYHSLSCTFYSPLSLSSISIIPFHESSLIHLKEYLIHLNKLLIISSSKKNHLIIFPFSKSHPIILSKFQQSPSKYYALHLYYFWILEDWIILV